MEALFERGFGAESEDFFGGVGHAKAVKDVAFSPGAMRDFAFGIREFDNEIGEGFDRGFGAGADIKRVAFESSGICGGDIGGDDILNGDEVTGLFAGAMDRYGGIAFGTVGEDADDSAVRGIWSLSGAVDVEVAEADSGEIEKAAVVLDVVLAKEFLRSVHGDRLLGRIFGGGNDLGVSVCCGG